MIERDLQEDLGRALSLADLRSSQVQRKIADSNLVGHALWLPEVLLVARLGYQPTPGEAGEAVLVGHNVCTSCELCDLAGVYPHAGWHLVPWRRCWQDDTDAEPAGGEAAPGDDGLSWPADPVSPWRTTAKDQRVLRLALVNPQPGVYRLTGCTLTPEEAAFLDIVWMSSPAAGACRVTSFLAALDTVSSVQGTRGIPPEVQRITPAEVAVAVQAMDGETEFV